MEKRRRRNIQPIESWRCSGGTGWFGSLITRATIYNIWRWPHRTSEREREMVVIIFHVSVNYFNISLLFFLVPSSTTIFFLFVLRFFFGCIWRQLIISKKKKQKNLKTVWSGRWLNILMKAKMVYFEWLIAFNLSKELRN